jgi:hypothetical protein
MASAAHRLRITDLDDAQSKKKIANNVDSSRSKGRE